MPLTPEEEKKLREQIRKELEERERRRKESEQKEMEERRRQLEERMRMKIREEEEERFYRERGYVKYINHRGGVEWLTPEEAKAREAKRKNRRPSSRKKAHRRKKILRWVGNGGIVVGILLVLLAIYKYNPTHGPRFGQLLVTADLPGGIIYLDGKQTHYITPDTLKGMAAGTHYVALFKDGYSCWPPMQIVRIKGGKLSTVHFQLKSSARFGWIKVLANQPQFLLFVDGIPQPVANRLQVTAGYHVVTVLKNGFLSQPPFQRVLVREGQTITLQFQFQPQGELGYLHVSSNQKDAFVYIDNQFTGWKANLQSIPVLAGEHQIMVRRNGYISSPEYEMITLEAGQHKTVIFHLQKTSQRQLVDIVTRKPGAAVILDGQWLPYVTPIAQVPVSPGEHFLNFWRAGKFYQQNDMLVASEKLARGRIEVLF